MEDPRFRLWLEREGGISREPNVGWQPKSEKARGCHELRKRVVDAGCRLRCVGRAGEDEGP